MRRYALLPIALQNCDRGQTQGTFRRLHFRKHHMSNEPPLYDCYKRVNSAPILPKLIYEVGFSFCGKCCRFYGSNVLDVRWSFVPDL